MFKLSGGLTGPAEINTGLKFVTEDNFDPYRSTKSRDECGSKEDTVLAMSGPVTG